MDCSQVRSLLSSYYDGEITSRQADRIAEHLACCAACAGDLASFRQLSELSVELADCAAREQWVAIERQLPAPSAWRLKFPLWRAGPARLLAMTAVVLFAVGMVEVVRQHWDAGWPGRDRHLAANFDPFLRRFPHDTHAAQESLLAQYGGRRAEIDEAARLLGYEPAVARGLPAGYSMEALYVLDMPCCRCAQAVLRNAAGERLAIFEHEKEQAMWFGERPSIAARCCGKSARIVENEAALAATWPSAQRRLTLVGARDLEEVARFIGHFDQAKPAL